MSAELAALVILGGFVLLLVATLLVVHAVERTRAERRRRRFLAQQLASDVRIQQTTDAAISQLLGVAREEMARRSAPPWPGSGSGYSFTDPMTIRVQQVRDEDDLHD